MRAYAATLLGVIAVAETACSSAHGYSERDVKNAFKTQGIDLRVKAIKGRQLRKHGDVVLGPTVRLPLLVGVIRSEKRAAGYYREFVAQKTADTFDCLRRNVLTVSDGGLTIADRLRVQAALQALKPKGTRVQCAPAIPE